MKNKIRLDEFDVRILCEVHFRSCGVFKAGTLNDHDPAIAKPGFYESTGVLQPAVNRGWGRGSPDLHQELPRHTLRFSVRHGPGQCRENPKRKDQKNFYKVSRIASPEHILARPRLDRGQNSFDNLVPTGVCEFVFVPDHGQVGAEKFFANRF
jgi:hypothetical protein